ncbi:Uu.00g050100.m01.CDS01 [Anthostomella pinea]|uniref:Uu.00g050100.m01.CDS01 n=1 Tax=Anthostomella pinea TaxID=933095 RepID=A0AAI8YMK5_9PEZI|nr:Uu.00g050100.m01.CDS01 [Anthostomella pinea]
MASADQFEAIREQVARAVADQLSRADIDWSSVEQLVDPVVCIEAKFRDRSREESTQTAAGLTVTHVVDLTGVVTPKSGTPFEPPEDITTRAVDDVAPSAGTILPSLPRGSHVANSDALRSRVQPRSGPAQESNSEEASDAEDEDHTNISRKAISGLRPSRGDVPLVENNTQRQMQIADGNFPKRRKAESVGYALKPSTLDKLIVGIWEQIHGGISIDPQGLMDQFMAGPLLQGAQGSQVGMHSSGLTQPPGASLFQNGRPFNDTNLFCRKVTQASRTCRSVEVIVQARWVEYFDAYVEHLKTANPSTSDTKHRKAALVEACSDFGWSDKELRNKMAIWRGYKEIKDAGGWASLVFAGMGIYRFCKYRIGFDKESMQRLASLRPALKVAADTTHPNWRQLLSIIGESPERVYHGHPHDWVVFPDGTPPAPLHTMYLQWDPYFNFRHIEECIIDERAWGGDDPRWSPPTDAALTRISPLPICATCSQEQSDDLKQNNCYCFPSLFGSASPHRSPVQVFRTLNGRSNGLLALCAFERGAAVGEFVGVVTRGLQDVDVMEGANAAGSTTYQIWQGRQGNFTRFVNHSCNANAQYQRFAWLDTQRVVLVSKGIEAGAEITVDYSDKYWRGLDKKCLCGEKRCRYRRDS